MYIGINNAGPTIDVNAIIDAIDVNVNIRFLNASNRKIGFEMDNCRVTKTIIMIILIMRLRMTMILLKPTVPAILNAYSIRPKPNVDNTTEALSNFTCLISLKFFIYLKPNT